MTKMELVQRIQKLQERLAAEEAKLAVWVNQGYYDYTAYGCRCLAEDIEALNIELTRIS